MSLSDVALAIYSGSWAFGGYATLNSGLEDVGNLRRFSCEAVACRTLPIATIGSLLLVTVIYLLVNASYFVLLTPDDFLKADAVATVSFSLEIILGIRQTRTPRVPLCDAGHRRDSDCRASQF